MTMQVPVRFEPIEVTTANMGDGAQITDCRFGPRALLDAGLIAAMVREGNAVIPGAAIDARGDHLARGDAAASCTPQPANKLSIVEASMPALATAVRACVKRRHFPLVLGGDHSCAVGTWSGIADAWRDRGRIGLIWIDAHLDSHTPETSETQAPHGMPLAALLGHGPSALTSLFGWSRKLLPQQTVIVGARSYEPGEAALLARLGVRVITTTEIAQRGLTACMDEAVAIATNGTCGYGVSFDLDVIDPDDAPAVGSPELAGMRAEMAITALRWFADDRRLLGFEFVEYNPSLDDRPGTTASLCLALLNAVLTPGHRHKAVAAAPRAVPALRRRHADVVA